MSLHTSLPFKWIVGGSEGLSEHAVLWSHPHFTPVGGGDVAKGPGETQLEGTADGIDGLAGPWRGDELSITQLSRSVAAQQLSWWLSW